MNIVEYCECQDINNLCSCSFKKTFTNLKNSILRYLNYINLNHLHENETEIEEDLLIREDSESQINQEPVIVTKEDLDRMYNIKHLELSQQLESYINENKVKTKTETDTCVEINSKDNTETNNKAVISDEEWTTIDIGELDD